MKLKHANPNNEIVISTNLYAMEIFVLKNCENQSQKRILYNIFSRRSLDCLQNKTHHNFHMTNSNWMNRSFPSKYEYNLLKDFFVV